MSGDVQPRKRKDKRRKKEDLVGQEDVPIPTVVPPPPVNEDFNIHVHNDHGTGGGLCAKLVFFILLSALAIFIGSVITQNRGLTDLDTPASESRFANIFSGWIDDSINSHDDDHHAGVDFEDKHGDAHEDDDEHQLSNEEHHESGEDAHGSEEDVHGSEEDAHGSEEDAHEDEEENHVSGEDEEEGEKNDVDDDQQVSEEEEQKDDDDDDDDNDNDDEEQLSEQDQEATEEDNQEDDKHGDDEHQISDEEHNDEEDNDDEQHDDDNDDEQHDEDDDNDDVQQDDEEHADDTAEQLDNDDDQQNEENQVDEQDQGTNESNENDDTEDNDIPEDTGSNEETDNQNDDEDEIENDQSHEDNNVDNDVMDELENASEAPSNVDDTPEESTQADTFTSKEQEIVEEDSAETNIEDFGEEEVTDNTAGVEELENEEEIPEVEEDNSSVAVKFGVGVALVVVAHIVLVRKWRSGQQNGNKSAKEEVSAEMSRRNTMIPVSTPDQLEQEIQNAEDEYSEEDEEELEEESEEEIITPTHKYMQFRTDYSSPRSAEDIVKQRIDSVQNAEPNVKYYYKKTDDVKQTDDNNDDGDEPEEEEEDELEEDNNEEVDEGDGETGNVEIEGDDVEVEDHEEIETGGDDVKSDEDVEGDDAEEEDSEEISDVDDDELLKKLEARYGKLSNKRFNNADDHDNDDVDVEDKYDSKKSGKITNIASLTTEKNVLKTDDKLREKLKNAENSLIDNVELALSLYTNLMEKLPNNAEVKYGRARALDKLAEIKRNNVLLQNAISSYYDLLQNSTISDVIFAFVGTRCIDLIRFSGVYSRAIYAHKKLIDRFPNDSKYLNELAVTLLTSNRLTEAKRVLQKVLARWPDNGFAQVHYGFILKVKENDLSGAIKYLQAGIKTNDPGVIDGRFYFHLGDALTRLGQKKEAIKVYEDGVEQNVFLSKYQRSLYNVNRLTAKPWWSPSDTAYSRFFHILKANWKIIRDEGAALLNEEKYFIDETEDLRDTGKWAQFELFTRGFKLLNNCKKCPETCKIIESFPDARDCKRGQVKFSVMHPGTHVWPHCGPTNTRLRAHLGLIIPSDTYIRVAEEIRYWKEGEVILFDDSFEHEVWHNGSDIRLILIIDVWHPELTDSEKHSLPPI